MNNEITTFHTLEEIRLRKDQLDEAINQDEEQIARLWNSLFTKKENSTKGEYIAAIVANSVTAIDAFLLIRKLTKSYSSVFKFFKKKKK
jgi:hypothetical protein